MAKLTRVLKYKKGVRRYYEPKTGEIKEVPVLCEEHIYKRDVEYGMYDFDGLAFFEEDLVDVPAFLSVPLEKVIIDYSEYITVGRARYGKKGEN